MKAMIFAAGLGTRLRPLTNDRPKALVEVGGVSLLEINIRRLIHFGVREIIINTHHFAEKMAAFLQEKNNFGIRIEISHEAERPLETGGGLKKAAWFFDDDQPFFVCNADILSNIDLQKLYHAHGQSGALATYAIQQRDTSRYMLHDANMQLGGWMNAKTKTVKVVRTGQLQMYSFSCFHVINPQIFDNTPAEDYFSMIDWYLQLAQNQTISGYLHNQDRWCDVGKPETLAEAENVAIQLLSEL
ncbi:MAG: nucleotidyltransferase family protein [Cytophagia bacterium]|nr:MAG: nucleotidyltransferase family protein [Cytophagales bacterium]TAG41222.1 MAG: nucleotidyltransferase family protein [Cytophagia bacterium]TAG56497.1 MAG: nucleotidyltransferase family protein [Runella slithyformis]TAG82907.1 MAG: nucleotidyltransferase family protein [Cytophagales bacterium]